MQLILSRSVLPMFLTGCYRTDSSSTTLKTEFTIIGSRKQLAEISVDSVTVGDAMIKPGTSLRNLGAWFDQHMTMSVNIGKMCSKAFYSLYNLRQIRKCLTDEACEDPGACTRNLPFRLL